MERFKSKITGGLERQIPPAVSMRRQPSRLTPLIGQWGHPHNTCETALLSEARRDATQTPRWDLNYCRTRVRFGVVEAINGNIRDADQPRPLLYEHALPPIESTAHGRDQHRIRRFSEG